MVRRRHCFLVWGIQRHHILSHNMLDIEFMWLCSDHPGSTAKSNARLCGSNVQINLSGFFFHRFFQGELILQP